MAIKSNIVSSNSFSPSKFHMTVDNSMDGTVLFLVTATTQTKFPILHSITFLPFDDLGVSPDGHE